jgi:molybdopterin biosynthesis enzyme
VGARVDLRTFPPGPLRSDRGTRRGKIPVVIPVEEARQRILSRISPLGTERVDLPGAFGRVLSEDVAATRDIPPWPNSSMDG